MLNCKYENVSVKMLKNKREREKKRETEREKQRETESEKNGQDGLALKTD